MDMRKIITLIENAASSRIKIEYDSGFDDPDADEEPRHGDTIAWLPNGEEAGRLNWHVEDGWVHIDSIEVNVPQPLVSFRMIDDMRALVGNLPIDPGMMNADGRRLWDLYRQKHKLNETEGEEMGREEKFVDEMQRWCGSAHPDCTLEMEAMLEDEGPEVYIDTIQVRHQGKGVGSSVLRYICASADRAGIKLTSKPTEIDNVPLDVLIKFNERFGFRFEGNDVFMTRRPKGSRPRLSDGGE